MNKKQQKEIFDGNELIKGFLAKQKLDKVELEVDKLLQRLSTIDHKLSQIENHIDTHSIQKIYDFDSRISDLERFETRLRESL